MRYLKFLLGFIIIAFLGCRSRSNFGVRTNQTPESRQMGCLLDKMSNNDTLFVEYESAGCFGGRWDDLYIVLRNDSFWCTYLKEITYDSSIVVRNQLLNVEQKNLYCDFQSKLQAYENGTEFMCTTSIHFIIQLNDQKIEVRHRDCGFSAYHDFKAALNKSEEKP
mgnify:CR=1 FL=1